MTTTKICSRCKQEKQISMFQKDKEKYLGVRCECKECASNSKKIYTEKVRQENKLQISKYQNNEKQCSMCKKVKTLDNFEKHIARHGGYTAFCKDCTRIKNKERYSKNKEKYKIMNKTYRQTEHGKVVRKLCEYKRKSKLNENKINPKEMLELLNSYDRCYWCHVSFSDKIIKTFDHYIPLYSGGENIISNIVIACSSCNSKKNFHSPEKFANELGRLL